MFGDEFSSAVDDALVQRDSLARLLSAARAIGEDELAAKLEYAIEQLDGLLAAALQTHTRH
jgi:hypothetical protein